ncbi:metallophosphoesterase family protein [Mucilaginibacter auburnensis]|uniref:3',5'-cyclic AMP phosphodiesterase CpdA n=1 Tax=Mucilaginibacter auburnensis TaxID=1457233 RepID=A0A2H9VN67_9SPHI|nr:metallophosphoesterase [Mucilaginibacter auburnensis]PJJ79760.1 3',5'-cyclic AMP phosphodiesterase CpdA [Mucilaginibacter auburnensis]
MNSRRKFIQTGMALGGLSLLPSIDLFAGEKKLLVKPAADLKLRFVVASDGHYAQPGTDGDKFYGDLITWLKKEHKDNHLDMVIINGDLVHDRPDLLPKLKKTYLDKLPVPCYAVPGNHDHVDAAMWKAIFGYEDNFIVDKGDVGFVLANTTDKTGKYVCPDDAFLKRSLDAFKNKPVVFVVLHVPPHLWLPEEKGNFIECPEIIELLHSYPNVKAVLHGHDHSLDVIRYTGKLPHIFDAHFGGNWGTAYKGYRIFEIGKDNSINTYQVNASQNPVINSAKF